MLSVRLEVRVPLRLPLASLTKGRGVLMGHFPGEGARCELYLANHILRSCDSSGVEPFLGIFYELSGVE